MHTSAVSLLLYLIKYVRITSVEQVRQPLLNPSDHLWPHWVYQEIITWYCVGFVTEGRGITILKILVINPVSDQCYEQNAEVDIFISDKKICKAPDGSVTQLNFMITHLNMFKKWVMRTTHERLFVYTTKNSVLNEFWVPGYGTTSHLSKQSTVMRNKVQQSWVHQLESIGTWLHHVFYNHLKEWRERRGLSDILNI